MNTLFTARFTGLWRDYKMPETISKSAYQRLKGAYMGYNSFDGAMEYWPEARWGNEKQINKQTFKQTNTRTYDVCQINSLFSRVCRTLFFHMI